MDIVSNVVELNLLDEFYKRQAFGEQPLYVPVIQRDLEFLEMQSQYRDFNSLWDLAEHKYQYGLVLYRLAVAMKNQVIYAKAVDAFRFVLYSNFRTQICTKAFLEWLIYDGPKP